MFVNLFLLLFWFSGSIENVKTLKDYAADHKDIRYSGRIDFSDPKEPVLIGSASYIEVLFSGDSCQIILQKLNPEGEHNYISLELDGKYLGRLKLENEDMESFPIYADAKSSKHHLKIYKATEASNGSIAFGGISAAKLHCLPKKPSRSIEFIGNSITCGMGIEWKEIPCDAGVWYDQHNAYWAYGSRVARELETQFLLSSVSGIGMYRNWNGEGPVMPQVYDNLYLNLDSNPQWKSDRFSPDLVSICLGTNDFSDGDGKKERLPFDTAKFVSEYIAFVENIYSRYPETQVVLLTSPMVNGEKGETFLSCLNAVKSHFSKEGNGKKDIAVYNFESIVPHGCGSHPDKEDHEKMASVLIPFYKDVMGW